MNRRLLYIVVVVALVVVIAFAWFVLLNPVRSDIAATEAAIETEQTNLIAAQAKLAQAEITRQEGRKNQARLLELAKMVPDSDEIPSLLVQVQTLAEQSGILFTAITPGDLIQSVDFQILPLEVEFTGTYFDLSDFVYRAEQMAAGPGRLLAIKQIALELGQAIETLPRTGRPVSPTLSVSMTLYAFEMNPTAQAAAVPSSPATTPTTAVEGTETTTPPSE